MQVWKRIFLPLRFYMKSILAKVEVTKKASILTVLEGQNFNFGKNSGLQNMKNATNSKFNANKIVKKYSDTLF